MYSKHLFLMKDNYEFTLFYSDIIFSLIKIQYPEHFNDVH